MLLGEHPENKIKMKQKEEEGRDRRNKNVIAEIFFRKNFKRKTQRKAGKIKLRKKAPRRQNKRAKGGDTGEKRRLKRRPGVPIVVQRK